MFVWVVHRRGDGAQNGMWAAWLLCACVLEIDSGTLCSELPAFVYIEQHKGCSDVTRYLIKMSLHSSLLKILHEETNTKRKINEEKDRILAQYSHQHKRGQELSSVANLLFSQRYVSKRI